MVAVYVPGSVAVRVEPVTPAISFPLRNHVYEVPPVAVNTCEPPGQMAAIAGEIVPLGAEATVTSALLDAGPSQSPWCIVAEYVPVCVTVNVAPVCPLISVPFLNQVYEVPPVAVSTVEPPAQIEAFAGEMLPVGAAAVVTVALLDAGPWQPPW